MPTTHQLLDYERRYNPDQQVHEWRAACSCGWRGDWQPSPRNAEHLGERHLDARPAARADVGSVMAPITDGRDDIEKRLTIWEQLVAQKARYIGGTLVDCDPDVGEARTVITDIVFRPNGTESFWFEVQGRDFACGTDTRYLGVAGGSRFGHGLEVRSTFGGNWHFVRPKHRPEPGGGDVVA